MEICSDRMHGAVRERTFRLGRDGELIPGVIWTPSGPGGPRPKVLFGHGGTQDKRAPNIVSLAHTLVRDHGYAAVCIDAPNHGDRISAQERSALRHALLGSSEGDRRDRGNPSAPYLHSFARGAADWVSVLDEVEGLSDVGAGPTGWWGVSMGTSIGLPFVATDERIDCAVLGLASAVERPGYDDYLGWAKQLSVPLLFLCQRDDAGHPIDRAFELWDLCGSADKTMHLNPGPHVGIPSFEREESVRFFVRHLGTGLRARG